MILIISHKADFTTDFLVNILNRRDIEYRRFNCEDIFSSEINIEINGGFIFSILGQDHYDSVWFRRTKFPTLDNEAIADRRYLLTEADALLKNIFAAVSAKWLSHPDVVYRAENKLYQLKSARSIGFAIPETLVTTSKEDLSAFYHENNGDVIIKPLSQTRLPSEKSPSFIFTNLVPPSLMDQLDSFDLTPCIFQRNIQKKFEVRVTVVGDNAFAASVDSQSSEQSKIDWRRERRSFERHELPAEVERLCVHLVKELGLGFGAIDLIYTPEGQYIFLEINPNGQWVWIEAETSLPISDAIIKYLTDE